MFGQGDSVDKHIQRRREVVFLILVGIFLGSLTMLNILGVSKIINVDVLGIPFALTIGVLPYPVTFLCTDFISELYGKQRANAVVWVGLLLNVWVLIVLWIGGALPPTPEFAVDDHGGILPTLNPETGKLQDFFVFYKIRQMTIATTIASMVAYLTAQFCDVHIFHFLKRITKGKHLWIRNNGSTLVSQIVDSFAVILIAHYLSDAFNLKSEPDAFKTLMTLIFSGYIFKLVSALLDTVPFYLGTKLLSQYLQIDPNHGYDDSDKH